ncbi:uncharacterized protein LOC116937387 [Petromyzon marinus]|uniref:uncharacterized protein LOC116937387 n=1 Tax=Petromyzon marinus TaxID=7757 RepID=UPI003F70939F
MADMGETRGDTGETRALPWAPRRSSRLRPPTPRFDQSAAPSSVALETGGRRHGDGDEAPAPHWSEGRKRRPRPHAHNAPRHQLTPPPPVSHNAPQHQLTPPPPVSHNAPRHQLTPPPPVSHNAPRHQLTPPPTSQNALGSRDSGEAARPASTQDAVRHGQEVLSPPRGFGSTDSNAATQMDVVLDPLSLESWGLPAGVVEVYAARQAKRLYAWQAECLSLPGVLQGGNLVFTAPTSSGKTVIAELLVVKRVLETPRVMESRRKALFVLPYVALAREKRITLQVVMVVVMVVVVVVMVVVGVVVVVVVVVMVVMVVVVEVMVVVELCE